MKKIIKTAIKDYLMALGTLLILISCAAIILANAVLPILGYTFLLFVLGEVCVFVLNKFIEFLKRKYDEHNR